MSLHRVSTNMENLPSKSIFLNISIIFLKILLKYKYVKSQYEHGAKEFAKNLIVISLSG
jgi:hypothetical protein